MALYHMHADIISRSSGSSAIGAAAYRAGEKLTSEYDGVMHDYTEKQNVVFSVIMLPGNAPAAFSDRETLWNAVEKAEKSVNAQLCRSIDVALPRELSFEEQKDLLLTYVKKTFVDQGMCADVCIHNPPRMNSHKQPINATGAVTHDPSEYIYDNPHAHILLTMRPINPDGNWEAKTQKLYLCERDGQQAFFTGEEFKKSEGWEKLYSYKSQSGKKSWHTKSYAQEHPEECAELVNRNPKSDQVLNPNIAVWNSRETYASWRASWADSINAALSLKGSTEQVSHLSYEEQGLAYVPTVHEGKYVTVEEKRLNESIKNGSPGEPKHTEIRSLNLAIKEHNRELKIIHELKALKHKMSALIEPVKARLVETSHSIAERLEQLRAKIIFNRIRGKDIVEEIENTERTIESNREYIEMLKPKCTGHLEKLSLEIAEKEDQLLKMKSPFQQSKKNALIEDIEMLNNQVSLYKENAKYAEEAEQEIATLEEVHFQASNKLKEFRQEEKANMAEYENIDAGIEADQKAHIDEERLLIRETIEEPYRASVGASQWLKGAASFDGNKTDDDSDFSMTISFS